MTICRCRRTYKTVTAPLRRNEPVSRELSLSSTICISNSRSDGGWNLSLSVCGLGGVTSSVVDWRRRRFINESNSLRCHREYESADDAGLRCWSVGRPLRFRTVGGSGGRVGPPVLRVSRVGIAKAAGRGSGPRSCRDTGGESGVGVVRRARGGDTLRESGGPFAVGKGRGSKKGGAGGTRGAGARAREAAALYWYGEGIDEARTQQRTWKREEEVQSAITKREGRLRVKRLGSSLSAFSGNTMLIVERPRNLLGGTAAATSGLVEGGGGGCAQPQQVKGGSGIGGGGEGGEDSAMGETADVVVSAGNRVFGVVPGRSAFRPAEKGRKASSLGGPLAAASRCVAGNRDWEEEFARCDARNLVIYEVFVRNHSPEGTFAAVEADLGRIKAMGVDVLWLMPHYPIGFEARKGTVGSPYAIADYRGVNLSYGTIEDFESLVRAARKIGLRFMIDIVFNHTARDSVLAKSHPEWFKRDKYGRPTSPWSDVADLSFHDKDLWEYLFDTLVFWAKKGVNGFRCDVASFVPLAFWQGEVGLCDSELYQVFDALYDYDLWFRWCAVLAGAERLQRYLEMLQFQRRIMSRAATRNDALAWTAFAAFNRGAFLMYAGQESEAREPPELFERDPIDWADYTLTGFLTNLARMKKSPAMRNGQFSLLAGEGAIVAIWQQPERESKKNLFGVFNVGGRTEGAIEVPLPDGEYVDILSGQLESSQSSQMQSEAETTGTGEASCVAYGNGNGATDHGVICEAGKEPRVVKVEDGKIEFSGLGSCMVVEYSGILRKARPMTNTILDFSTGAAVF
ncbi:hypothetical protein CBR_g55382 [Chara braunii]|uniref:Glycosyl hydrolase family 13 catalytic domain-containing protein n=1 Tax=Chara braunii TaxID=69332 RepID=A0A388K7L5_CHABU|nr:hypothetical protein CBR_g55382 [Chara braunii]|eukprot:GBG66038.1 hypothetical protein CBR_g55382 [Chara braunii]